MASMYSATSNGSRIKHIGEAPLIDIAGSSHFVIENLPPNMDWRDLKEFLHTFGSIKEVKFLTSSSAFVEYSSSNEALAVASKLHAGTISDYMISVKPFNQHVHMKKKPVIKIRRNMQNLSNEQRDQKHFGSSSNGQKFGFGKGRGIAADQTDRNINLTDDDMDSSELSGPRAVDPTAPLRTVFIFGIPFSMNYRDIKYLTQKYGPGYVTMDMESFRKNRGFAVVKFDQIEAAQACIAELNGSMLEGRHISVRADRNVSKDSSTNSVDSNGVKNNVDGTVGVGGPKNNDKDHVSDVNDLSTVLNTISITTTIDQSQA